jgi:glycosyltransferase involved in cell wall biosynthesis
MPRVPDPLAGGIVYFGNSWAAENRTSSHHVARRLARQTTLLYVDSPGMRTPVATGRDIRRVWATLRAAVARPYRPLPETLPGLWRCTVPQLPWRWLPGVKGLNRAFGAWAVRRAARLAGVGLVHPPLVWCTVPHPVLIVEVLPRCGLVYYCIDDYAAHPGVDAGRISACDQRLSRLADVVFVAPPALLEAKRRVNPSVHAAPHGVDADHFARAQDPATEIPSSAAALRPGPVIGYFGLLAAWTDLDLLLAIARAHPDWQLLLVGHAAVDVSQLQACANVHLVGPQPYESLPSWARSFDVAIIPYRNTQQVRHANPLKLREYLACGLPVVSVPAPEVDRFAPWVVVAEGSAAFVEAVERTLAGNHPELPRARMAAVANMSWETRVAEALATVRDTLSAQAADNWPNDDGPMGRCGPPNAS